MHSIRHGIINAGWLIIFSLILVSCQPTPTPAIVFEDVLFDRNHTHFSITNRWTQPIDSNAAKLVADQIDFTYVFPDGDAFYSVPGIMNPVSRSQTWSSMNQFKQTWLSNSIPIRLYRPTITQSYETAHFEDCEKDEKVIGKFFDNGWVTETVHPPYNNGDCIGGMYDPDHLFEYDYNLFDTGFLGFELVNSGKRGLFRVTDREYYVVGPPNPNTLYWVKIEMVMEH